MNRRQKGKYYEKKAREELESEGWTCWSPPATRSYQSQDLFGMWDIICVRGQKELKFVQVKSGNVSGGMKKLKEHLSTFLKTTKVKVSAELWEWKNLKSLKGWRKTKLN